MTRKTRIAKTSELQVGDVVICHGLRCLIDQPLTESGSRKGTFWTRALVLNRDEVPNRAVPVSWTRDWQATGLPAEDGSHRWTIQGNDLAQWAVEIEDEAAGETPPSPTQTYAILYSYPTSDRYYRGQRGTRVEATSEADALAQIRRGAGGYPPCPDAQIVRCRIAAPRPAEAGRGGVA